ncbi:MAG TPA: nucleotidyltransferase family protein [Chloroflexota bacterium]|nr:nucleotidyltransferase family protein [Chloroflexota bacterium]
MSAAATPALFGAWGRAARQVARDNKLLDLYLEMQTGSGAPSRDLEACRQSRNAIQQTIAALVSRVQADAVEWAVFKTVRPFPFTPSDVDVVVLTDDGARPLASRLRERGYSPSGGAPYTITLCDSQHDVGIDLYQDIASSRFVYLDRATLRPYRTWQVQGGVAVPGLQPVAELVAILAHAVYKEQLFTLADYLTLWCYGQSFAPADWEELLTLARANGVRSAVLWGLRVAKGVAHVVGDVPPWPQALDRALGVALRPRTMPYRLLHPGLLAAAIAERGAVSRLARRSLARLLAQGLNPLSLHTRSFYRQLWKRAKGATY